MKANRHPQVLFVLLLLLPAAVALSLATGRVALPFSELLHGLAEPKPNLAWLILSELRVPRTLLALVGGADVLGGGSALVLQASGGAVGGDGGETQRQDQMKEGDRPHPSVRRQFSQSYSCNSPVLRYDDDEGVRPDMLAGEL